MSLLLELIRQLLECLEVPAERLVLIWESYFNRRSFLHALGSSLPSFLPGINLQLIEEWETKEYGRTRSIVRVIGTLLPLDPCPRPHFQQVSGHEISEFQGPVCRTGIPALTDVTWLSDDEVVSNTRFRYNLPTNQCGQSMFLGQPCKKKSDLVPFSDGRASDSLSHPASDNAIKKIAALEDELVQLRTQIAAIVAMQETRNTNSCSETLCSFGSPNNLLPPPSLASTPLSSQLVQSVAPTVPPPPPPPLPSTKLNSSKSAIELIKERKAAHKQSPKEADVETSIETVFPSMLDVLKDMNKIRLRAVERSPGGTPVTKKDKKRRSLNDPAAIIAHALKQKFAHRHREDSLEKENQSYENSSFSSPETPQFGRHLLKPVGLRAPTKREGTQVLVKTRPHV